MLREGSPNNSSARAKRRFINQMAKFTGRSAEQVERDHDRDNFLTADQAKDYGIVDQVLQKRVLGG